MNLTMLWRLVPCQALCLNSACKRHIMAPFLVRTQRTREVEWLPQTHRAKPRPRAVCCQSRSASPHHTACPFSSLRIKWEEQMGSNFNLKRNWEIYARKPKQLASSNWSSRSSHFQPFCLWQSFSPRVSSLIFPGEVIKVQALFHCRSLFSWTQVGWCSWNGVEFSGQQ